MVAYEVRLNGRKVATVGLQGVGDLLLVAECLILSNKKWEAAISADGLQPGSPDTGEFMTWFKRKLRLGDEVSYRLIETDCVDKPRKISRRKERA